jgi:hypothetical protein
MVDALNICNRDHLAAKLQIFTFRLYTKQLSPALEFYSVPGWVDILLLGT